MDKKLKESSPSSKKVTSESQRISDITLTAIIGKDYNVLLLNCMATDLEEGKF